MSEESENFFEFSRDFQAEIVARGQTAGIDLEQTTSQAHLITLNTQASGMIN